MVSCGVYNCLNHENFIVCILKIHATAAKVPCINVFQRGSCGAYAFPWNFLAFS